MIKKILYKLLRCSTPEVDHYKCETIYDLYVNKMAAMLTCAGAYGTQGDIINNKISKYKILNHLPVIYFSYLYNINKISKKEMIHILEIMCVRGQSNITLVPILIQEMSEASTTENIDMVSSALKFEDAYPVYFNGGIIPFLVVEFGKWVIDNEYNIFIGILNIIDNIELKQYYNT